jgi:D-alanyl-D-alanine carboxypeptidase
MLLIEADSGRVLHSENATQPWYPASVTKVMTAYATLKAVKAGRLSLDTLLTVSPNAAAQAPTKMGLQGRLQDHRRQRAEDPSWSSRQNDMSVVLAEGVSGSIAAFAEEMNQHAARLGMTQTTYVNPNGLPADEQVTSARDQAILARAVYNELPEYDRYWNISAIKFGQAHHAQLQHAARPLSRNRRTEDRLHLRIRVQCGGHRQAQRTAPDRGDAGALPPAACAPSRSRRCWSADFRPAAFSWLTPSMGTVDSLQPVNAAPPNLREEVCGKKRKRPARESEDLEDEAEAALPPGIDPNSPQAVMLSSLRTANTKTLGAAGRLHSDIAHHRGVSRRVQGFGPG